jgi:hypothetical protein
MLRFYSEYTDVHIAFKHDNYFPGFSLNRLKYI